MSWCWCYRNASSVTGVWSTCENMAILLADGGQVTALHHGIPSFLKQHTCFSVIVCQIVWPVRLILFRLLFRILNNLGDVCHRNCFLIGDNPHNLCVVVLERSMLGLFPRGLFIVLIVSNKESPLPFGSLPEGWELDICAPWFWSRGYQGGSAAFTIEIAGSVG